jgi:mono/diheme cytochrome c family protein
MKKELLRGVVFGVLAVMATGAGAGLTPEQLAKLPPPAGHQVDFGREIKPIIEARCVKCHARGKSKGDFSLETRETLLKGGESGAAVQPGNGRESLLVALVSGLDPDSVMPKKGSRLSAEQVGLVRAWIDQGAKWEAGVTFARPRPLNLKPRKPVAPQVAGVSNPVDAFIRVYAGQRRFAPPAPVADRVFARRAALDIAGLVPTPEELDQFVASRDPEKRARWVRRWLDDRANYAVNWLSFWNDLLRNDYRGTGYIDGGRKQITAWLFSSLVNNLPYDKFVAQLVNPKPESEGFAKGIVWRGAVNASQTPPIQAAQNISQVFMGVNLKCASCHDSFINDWTLAEAYGLANIYSEEPLELFRCDQPTGQKAGYRFLYPELGKVSDSTNKAERLESLAKAVVSDADGRLSRTILNRIWARFFGRGLVEPLDDMDNLAWNQDLLDWLAEDLADHHFDLKETIYRITTSEAYQWPAVNLGERVATNFVFRGPATRRMSAEQFRDAVGELTGVWYGGPAGEFDFSCLMDPADAGTNGGYAEARWIWDRAEAAQKAPVAKVFFRREFVVGEEPTEAAAFVVCDNGYTLFVNGRKVGEGKDYTTPNRFDVRSFLKVGTNVVAVAAYNGSGDDKNSDNPAGGENRGANGAGDGCFLGQKLAPERGGAGGMGETGFRGRRVAKLH